MTTMLMTNHARTPAVTGGAADALLATATSDVLVLSTQTIASPSPFGVLRQVNYANLRRGVRYRVVVPDLARATPVLAHQLTKLALAGAAVRTVADVRTDTLIIDRATAVYPADRGVAPFGLPGVVTTAIEHFERVWVTAAPLLPSDLSDTTELGARERELLSLLAAGRTDAAAADELGVSIRTVRRLVSGIMNRLGARSRFMAGAKAADRGWLPA
jgi:DNA-binding CsgD family transcriptional regulator